MTTQHAIKIAQAMIRSLAEQEDAEVEAIIEDLSADERSELIGIGRQMVGRLEQP